MEKSLESKRSLERHPKTAPGKVKHKTESVHLKSYLASRASSRSGNRKVIGEASIELRSVFGILGMLFVVIFAFSYLFGQSSLFTSGVVTTPGTNVSWTYQKVDVMGYLGNWVKGVSSLGRVFDPKTLFLTDKVSEYLVLKVSSGWSSWMNVVNATIVAVNALIFGLNVLLILFRLLGSTLIIICLGLGITYGSSNWLMVASTSMLSWNIPFIPQLV